MYSYLLIVDGYVECSRLGAFLRCPDSLHRTGALPGNSSMSTTWDVSPRSGCTVAADSAAVTSKVTCRRPASGVPVRVDIRDTAGASRVTRACAHSPALMAEEG